MKERIQTYMKEQSLSQSATAKQLGISEAAMSRYLAGSYPNPESIEKKIGELLIKQEQRQTEPGMQGIPFAYTSISQHVINTLEYALLKKNISVIYGDAGIGKTRTAAEWVKGRSDILFLTAAPALSNPKSFFKYLARELKIVRVGHIDDLYLDLLDRLAGSDKMLVIDEAQHLTLKTLENLRGLQEATNTAMVLIGNETVYTKMVGRQQAEFAQLFSRIGWRKHLLTDQFVADDVTRVFGTQEEAAGKLLLEICHSKYGLRGAVHTYTNAANNGDTTAKGLRKMAQTMGILL